MLILWSSKVYVFYYQDIWTFWNNMTVFNSIIALLWMNTIFCHMSVACCNQRSFVFQVHNVSLAFDLMQEVGLARPKARPEGESNISHRTYRCHQSILIHTGNIWREVWQHCSLLFDHILAESHNSAVVAALTRSFRHMTLKNSTVGILLKINKWNKKKCVNMKSYYHGK